MNHHRVLTVAFGDISPRHPKCSPAPVCMLPGFINSDGAVHNVHSTAHEGELEKTLEIFGIKIQKFYKKIGPHLQKCGLWPTLSQMWATAHI